MSATMARQESQEQVDQSNMCLALNLAIMAKGGILRTVIRKRNP